MKIFVSAAFGNRAAAAAAMDRLRSAGHVISFDWTSLRTDLPPDRVAEDELLAVANSDALVYLVDDLARGALVEFGAALALGRLAIAVGNLASACLFVSHHPAVVHARDMDAVLAILDMAMRAA